MNKNAMIMVLETPNLAAPGSVAVNDGIEMIPRLPIQCKVSVKERIAPIRFKFEFYNPETQK